MQLLAWASTLVLFLAPNYAISFGLNITDVSTLKLQWDNNGYCVVQFSFIHPNSKAPSAQTPWIALISCDFNATNASQEVDIFTLARDKGALSASSTQLLYSVYSTACIINPGYSNAETSNHPLDIFSTQRLSMSRLVESQFRQIGSLNGTYDSQMLNDSAGIIKETLSSGSVTSPTFLFATLEAYNATSSSPTTTIGNDSRSSGALHSSLPSIFAGIACILFEGLYLH
ncbi:hypothetical protein F5146DRAFT_1023150 [Armillaria mellea]|nr:hypothetical protein F5146DRAFT_1023150 [Armillaria mellea]